MGYVFKSQEFNKVLQELGKEYRLYAPVLKKGEGRYTDQDVVRYDFVDDADGIEWDLQSDYAFKEFMLPVSETLFYFTENETKEADIDEKPVIIFLRSCDLHAVKRLDHMYLENGTRQDTFYKRLRDLVSFALIGCSESFENCFCVDMGTNRAEDGYVFSVNAKDGEFRCKVCDSAFEAAFDAAGGTKEDVEPAFVTENEVHVTVPENIPLSIYKSEIWDEYTARCATCGRCNIACPTCTCYTMQDVFYTDNGKVGERRRVAASCMIDGYTDVAGGGQYRRTGAERMRFKVLHKIKDFKARAGYDMCVGCGRCDKICPEYISFANCINKVNKEVEKEAGNEQ